MGRRGAAHAHKPEPPNRAALILSGSFKERLTGSSQNVNEDLVDSKGRHQNQGIEALATRRNHSASILVNRRLGLLVLVIIVLLLSRGH